MTGDTKAPVLDDDTVYETWVKDVKIWLLATNAAKERRAALLVLAMKGRARSICRNLSEEVLKKDDGVDKVLEELKSVFQQDSTQSTFAAIENFEKLIRNDDQSINDYVSTFSEHHRELKMRLGGKDLYSSEILAYRLLSQANLTEEQRRLIRATCDQISFEKMVAQLKKAFGEGVPVVSDKQIKEEALFYTRNQREQSQKKKYPDQFLKQREKCKLCDKFGHHESMCWVRDAECYNCHRRGHLSKKCLMNSDRQINIIQKDEILEIEKELYLTLEEEAGIRGVLDSGASATVCGSNWLKRFEEYNRVRVSRNFSVCKNFRFGDGVVVPSSYVCELQVFVCGKSMTLNCHVLESQIPLLISGDTLKAWNAVVDFAADKLIIDGEATTIYMTNTGHQCICLTPQNDPNSIFSITTLTPLKIANKLHKYFSHGSQKKIKDLVRDSSHPEKKKIIQEIERIDCEECSRLAKSKPKRKTGMTLGRRFNETVSMDLKLLHFSKGKSWVIHMICSCTRFSIMVPVKSKAAEEILEKIFTHWIAIFGRPERFLTDNGGEFVNEEFLEMSSRLDINVKVTPAESPSCNGITERHNGILGNMVVKTKNDTGCNVATACSWASNAKNCLANHFGFSPHQLVFGYNPSVPSVLTDNHLPAHGGGDCESDLVEKHLTARRVSRLKFLECESNYKLNRVIRSKGRYQDKTRYVSGDRVYYKREAQKSWLGPATVIGSMDNQVLVKHGGGLIRVHPCKLMLKNSSPIGNEKEIESRVTEESHRIERTEDSEDSDHEEDPPSGGRGKESSEGPPSGGGKKYEQSRTYSFRPRKNRDLGETGVNDRSGMNDDPVPGADIVVDSDANVDDSDGDVDSVSVADRDVDPVSVEDGDGDPVSDANVEDSDGDVSMTSVGVEIALVEDEETCEIFSIIGKDELYHAKNVELNRLKEFEVFEEVPETPEQKISTRWVVTRKDNGTVKARLVARGFEEILGGPTHSPTVSKFAIRILLGMAALPNWTLKSIDVTSAFLQAKEIDRDVYILPPKEVRKPGLVWKLRKSLYGLGDASRRWYFTISAALQRVCEMSKIDKTTFFAKDGKGNVIGMIVIHVDDLLMTGTPEFFTRVEPAVKMFKLGRIESTCFTYLGWEVKKQEEKIVISQERYVKAAHDSLMELLKNRRIDSMTEKVSKEQEDLMRRSIGKLSWLANQTQPHLCFSLLELTTEKVWTGKHLKMLKKIVKSLESTEISFRQLDLSNLHLAVYTDASLGNLPEYKSGAGFVVYLADGQMKNLVGYSCGKVKRVVKSTFSAELYSVSEGLNFSVLIRSFLSEIIGRQLPICIWSDSKQVVDAVNTMSSYPRDKVNILELREIQDFVNKDVAEVKWIPTKDNPADVLTKRGVSPDCILQSLK